MCKYASACSMSKSLHSASNGRVDLVSATAVTLFYVNNWMDDIEQLGSMSSCLKKSQFKL